MMPEERSLWACATWAEESLGEGARQLILDKIGTLAEQGDTNGATIWRAIADRYDQLQAGITARGWWPT